MFTNIWGRPLFVSEAAVDSGMDAIKAAIRSAGPTGGPPFVEPTEDGTVDPPNDDQQPPKVEEGADPKVPQTDPPTDGDDGIVIDPTQFGQLTDVVKDGLILGKYKTWADVEKAHRELERQFHQARQQGDDTDDDTDDPHDPTGDDGQFDFGDMSGFAIGEPRNYEELGTMMETRPRDAAFFVMQRAQFFGPDQTRAVVNNWAMREPIEAMSWMVQQQLQAVIPQFEERLAPITQDRETQMVDAATAKVREFPHYEHFEPAIAELMNANRHLIPDEALSTTDGIVSVIEQFYNMAVGQAYRNGTYPTDPAPADDPPAVDPPKDEAKVDDRRRVVASRTSTAPAPSSKERTEDADVSAIKSRIMGARGG